MVFRLELFQKGYFAVTTIGASIGDPFPKSYAGILVNPGFNPVYRTAFLRVPGPNPRNIYREVGNSYFAVGQLPSVS